MAAIMSKEEESFPLTGNPDDDRQGESHVKIREFRQTPAVSPQRRCFPDLSSCGRRRLRNLSAFGRQLDQMKNLTAVGSYAGSGRLSNPGDFGLSARPAFRYPMPE
jgi:hypothetical protein